MEAVLEYKAVNPTDLAVIVGNKTIPRRGWDYVSLTPTDAAALKAKGWDINLRLRSKELNVGPIDSGGGGDVKASVLKLLTDKDADIVAALGNALPLGKVLKVTGTAFNLGAAQEGNLLLFTSNSPVALSLHDTAPIGYGISGMQRGTGQITISATNPVNEDGAFKSRKQNSTFSCICIDQINGVAVWAINGSLVA